MNESYTSGFNTNFLSYVVSKIVINNYYYIGSYMRHARIVPVCLQSILRAHVPCTLTPPIGRPTVLWTWGGREYGSECLIPVVIDWHQRLRRRGRPGYSRHVIDWHLRLPRRGRPSLVSSPYLRLGRSLAVCAPAKSVLQAISPGVDRAGYETKAGQATADECSCYSTHARPIKPAFA